MYKSKKVIILKILYTLFILAGILLAQVEKYGH
jgi:hypothetical protein